MKQKLKIFALSCILFVLTNCDPAVKRYLGIERKAPDEYSVMRSSPLSVPPNFDLTTPGEPKKQTKDPSNSTDAPLSDKDKLFLKKAKKATTTNNIKISEPA
jgi:hypothetical protein